MHEPRSFLAMGGYAFYVWPAYGITIAAFAMMLIWTLRGRSARRREEKQLAAMGRRGRARRGEQA